MFAFPSQEAWEPLRDLFSWGPEGGTLDKGAGLNVLWCLSAFIYAVSLVFWPAVPWPRTSAARRVGRALAAGGLLALVAVIAFYTMASPGLR